MKVQDVLSWLLLISIALMAYLILSTVKLVKGTSVRRLANVEIPSQKLDNIENEE